MRVFDIIGPVMIGPSSSHTAGAVRMGNLALKLLEDIPVEAVISLHGSFSDTAKGHGTDRAIIGGLLGYGTDDERIVDSFGYAGEAGMIFCFAKLDLQNAHPNTAVIKLKGKTGKDIKLQLASVGGGRIILNMVDNVKVRYTGEYPTLIVFNRDVPGVVVSVSSLIADESINITEMRVYQSEIDSSAVMIINMNKSVDSGFLEKCRLIREIYKVIYLDKLY